MERPVSNVRQKNTDNLQEAAKEAEAAAEQCTELWNYFTATTGSKFVTEVSNHSK